MTLKFYGYTNPTDDGPGQEVTVEMPRQVDEALRAIARLAGGGETAAVSSEVALTFALIRSLALALTGDTRRREPVRQDNPNPATARTGYRRGPDGYATKEPDALERTGVFEPDPRD